MSRNMVDGNCVPFEGKIQEKTLKEEGAMTEETPPRRVVLRGALAIGCGLWIPLALSACDSKKGVNSTSAVPASSPPAATNSSTPSTSGKVLKATVQYQTQPKGEQKCGTCTNFIAESNTCKLVEGPISPDGWCTLWAKKA